MQLHEFLIGEMAKTSDSAIPFGVLYAVVQVTKVVGGRVLAKLGKSTTKVEITGQNGSRIEMMMDPAGGAADLHVTPGKGEKER